MFAAEIRSKRVQAMRQHTHWRWNLDEVYVKINGDMHYLWRAVDQEGDVLESFVTKTRDKAAALKFIKKAMKRYGSAKAITTDGLHPYKAAIREIGNAEKQEIGRWINNRCENSHQPSRRRERRMLRFRQMKSLQKFSSVHASVHNHFNQERRLTSRETFKANRSAALAEWRALMDEAGRGGASAPYRRQVVVRLPAPPRSHENLSLPNPAFLTAGIVAQIPGNLYLKLKSPPRNRANLPPV